MIKSEDIEWFANRLNTSSTGHVIVPSYVVKKYRKLKNDFHSDATVIRSIIIDLCTDLI